tara:strand:- start:36 stop:755 length:720 start_codon:yes stop_codon:yes gene_type:complete
MNKRKAVSADVGRSNVPLEVTPANPFNIVALDEVKLNWKTDDDGVKTCHVSFAFYNKTKERSHFHYENMIDGDIGRLTEKKRLDAQDAHFAHMFNCYMGDGAHATAGPNGSRLGGVLNAIPADAGEGYKATVQEEADYDKFLASIVHSFNTGRAGKPIWLKADGAKIPTWLKVVYSPKGKLQVPLYNNFLEKVVEGKRHLLVINPMYDAVQQPSQESMAKPNTPVAAEGVNADDLGFDF